MPGGVVLSEPRPGDDHAELELFGAVAVLRLTRPEVHNVVAMATIDRLEQLLDQLDADPEVRVLVLTGRGVKSFCAGSDLADLAPLVDGSAEQRAAALDMSPRMSAILDRLEAGPRVTIAALVGSAYGGGCELLTACHLRVAGQGIHFSFRQAAMGVSTGWGGGVRLFRLVGRSRALRLLLTADTVDTDEALRIGLVDFLVPQDQVLDEALALAERIAGNAPASIAAFLELARAADQSPETARAVEERSFGELWQGEAFWQQVATWRDRGRGR